MKTSPTIAFALDSHLDPVQLARVVGGQGTGSQDIPALGRCGPSDRWQWLGDVYTPECLAHDRAVRDNLASGQSTVGAHVRALPKLPAAIGSYVRHRLGFGGGTSTPPSGN